VRLQKNTLLALASALEFAARPGEQLSAAGVAAKYRVSPHHLSKVLRSLGRAGMLEAVRGARGGYRFSGNAKRLTLLDVIELFEEVGGPMRGPARPARRAGEGIGAHEIEAALGVVFAEIDELARATFGSITLQTLLKLIERRRAN
jgi:Rrf2 family protein